MNDVEPFPSPPDRHGEHQHSIDSVEEPLSPTLEFPGLVGPTSWGLEEDGQDDDEDVDLDLDLHVDVDVDVDIDVDVDVDV